MQSTDGKNCTHTRPVVQLYSLRYYHLDRAGVESDGFHTAPVLYIMIGDFFVSAITHH